MPGFLYFASQLHEPHPKREALVAWGLGYAFADVQIDRRGVLGSGPDGQPGVCFSAAGRKELGYFPAAQTWRKIPAKLLAENAPPLWLGFDTAAPPQPADLARETMLAGHPVKLADGHDWQCPAAIAVDASADELRYGHRLPQQSTLDDDGQWRTAAVLPQYAELLSIASDYWRAFHRTVPDAEGKLKFDFAGVHERVVKCLSVNYRVGPCECAALGVLSEAVVGDVLLAAIDWPTYRLWIQKKTEQARAGGSSSAGPED